jgi:hypothetical protein
MYDFSNFTGARGRAGNPGGGGFDFGDRDISIRIKPPQAQGVGNQVAGSKPNAQGGPQGMQSVNTVPWQQIAGSKGGL